MEHIISEEEINILNILKDKPLLNGYRLCYITNFEIGEVETKKGFFNSKRKRVNVLTKYEIKFFHSIEKEIYTANDGNALAWLPISDMYESDGSNILRCRKQYLSVKETLEGFGHKLISDHELKQEKYGDKF